jgi:hypothetical protein
VRRAEFVLLIAMAVVVTKLYQLAGGVVADNNAKVLPHIAHTVSVTGDVYEKDGMTMIRADDLKIVQ